MVKNDLFPIRFNNSIIPPGFQFYSVDLHSQVFAGLNNMSCTCIVAVNSPPGWQIKRTGKVEANHIDLFFPITGEIVLQTSQATFSVKPGELMIIPSWYERIVSINVPCYHIYVSFFRPEIFPEITDVVIQKTSNSPAVAFYTKNLLRKRRNWSGDAVYRSHVAECLAMLFHYELKIGSRQSPSGKVEKLLELLKTIPATDLNVHQVAAKFCMSISAFRKFCLLNFGKSPNTLVNETRMSRARALLIYSDYSIEEIAEQLGYADRFVFSKAFLRLNNHSPVKFRKINSLIGS